MCILLVCVSVCAVPPVTTVGFEQESYTFAEDDTMGVVRIVSSDPSYMGNISVVGGKLMYMYIALQLSNVVMCVYDWICACTCTCTCTCM